MTPSRIRRRASPPAWRLDMLLVWAGFAVLPAVGLAAPGVAATGRDTLGLRFEFGAATSYTNVLHFEDAFTDTTFLGRQRIADPESDQAAVMSATVAGTRAAGETRFELRQDLSLGSRLRSIQSGVLWSLAAGPDWRLALSPRGAFRNDRTLGRDLEEWRAGLGMRAIRRVELDAPHLELGLGGDLLRTRGSGSEFVLDREAVHASVALDRTAILGVDWRLGYAVAARSFPDSSVRDHVEHAAEARLRVPATDAGHLRIELEATRRAALRQVPTSRDRFWETRATVEFAAGEAGAVALRARVEGQATRYDTEDSTLYFDYQVARGRIGPRFGAGAVSLWVGSAAEALWSRLAPGEGYQEVGGFAELEWVPARGWWSVAPGVGWRDYDEAEDAPLGLASLHASFAFVGLTAAFDQELPAGLRLRVLADGRWESHVDRAQDGGSLYFSVDVRRLF